MNQSPYEGETATLLRGPDGGFYYIYARAGRVEKVDDEGTKVLRELFDRFFLYEEPWVPALYGAFLKPLGPGGCCTTHREELEKALLAWQKRQKK